MAVVEEELILNDGCKCRALDRIVEDTKLMNAMVECFNKKFLYVLSSAIKMAGENEVY